MSRKLLSIVAVVALGAGLLYAQADKAPSPGTPGAPGAGAPADPHAAPTAPASALKTNKDRISYGIGLSIGQEFKQSGLDIDMALLNKGIADALAGNKPAVSPQEYAAAMQELQKDMEAKEKSRQDAAGLANANEGKAFLEANKSKEGVKTTASGLQYLVVKEGEGKSPAATDQVKVHYKGTLIDGSVFDSSYDRGEPIVFPVNGVIKGWTEALQLMKPGSKYKLFIPSELAYGARGAGGRIGPHAVLLFEVELLEVQSAK
jgi:FKBP-type peptidyl-prolyl cis-trans isomerase FklB